MKELEILKEESRRLTQKQSELIQELIKLLGSHVDPRFNLAKKEER